MPDETYPLSRGQVSRAKSDHQRRWSWRIAYAARRVMGHTLGQPRCLDVLLDIAWISHRLAYEQSNRVLGDSFRNGSLATSDEILRLVVTPGARVLDIGCSDGRLLQRLAALGATAVGIDISDGALHAARRRRYGSPVSLAKVSVTDDLSSLGYFDVAIMSHVLEHLEEPVSVLSTLRPSARVAVVEVPDAEADSLNLARVIRGRPMYSDADHLREYTEKTLLDDATEAGWSPKLFGRRGGCLVLVAENASSVDAL